MKTQRERPSGGTRLANRSSRKVRAGGERRALKTRGNTKVECLRENAKLRARLADAEQILEAIRNGDVDALVIRRPEGEQVFTLQGAEAPYRFLIEEMSEGALLLGTEGTVNYANAQFARWVGMSPGNVIGSNLDRFFAQEERAPLKKLLQAAQDNSIRADLLLLSEQSAPRPVGISLRWLEREQLKGFSVVVTDQSASKETENRLRQSEAQFRAFFHTVAVGTAQLGLDGRLLEVNERLSQITGYSREELLHMTPAELTHPEDRQREDQALSDYLAGHRPTYQAEKRYVRKGGEIVWVEVTAAMLRDSAGKPLRSAGIIKDITARKHAEEALRESEELLRAFTDNSTDAIYVKDCQSRWLMANPTLLKIAGKTSHEVLGRTDVQIYADPAIGRAILDNDLRIMERGEPEAFEERAQTPEGIRLFLSTKSPRRDAQGRVIGLVGISRDITERKRAEEALQKSEQQLRIALGAGGMGTWTLDLATSIVSTDTLHRRLWDIPGDDAEIPAEVILSRVHPEDASKIFRTDQLSEISAPFDLEFRVCWRNGEVHWLRGSAIPLQGADGRVARIAGVNFDVTSQKQSETALRKSEQRLSLALENGQMGLWEWIPHSQQSIWNAKEYELLGLPVGDGTAPDDLFFRHVHPDDAGALKASLEESLKNAGNWEHEFRIVRTDGQVRWLAGAGRFLRLANQPDRMVGVNYDITVRKETEALLARSKEELEALVAQRTAQLELANRDLKSENQHRRLLEQKLLAAVEQERQRLGQELHDGLCQVLTATKFKIGLLERKLARRIEVEPAAARALELDVNRAIKQARAMAHGLNPVELVAQGLVYALQDLAGSVRESSQLNCICECSKQVAIADQNVAQQLYRIAQEAVQNALKHGKPRNLRLKLKAVDDSMVLVVLDDGTGFSPGFEPSQGMGLRNMHAWAESIGGTLDIRRGLRGGTIVTCTVPRPPNNSASA